MWNERRGSLRFTPPPRLVLDTAVLSHDLLSRRLRMRPVGMSDDSGWSVRLPDLVQIAWYEPLGDRRIGVVYADLAIAGDTLRGRAFRGSDVSDGRDPYADVMLVRATGCV